MTRKAPLALVTAGFMALTVGACSSDEGPTVSAPSSPVATSAAPTTSESSTSSTSSSSSSSASPADQPLKAGDCLGPQPDYERVACDEGHTFEIYHVEQEDTHADDLVKRGAWSMATCYTEGAKFLGNEGFGVTRISVEPVPTTVNTDADKVIACMAKEYRTSGTGLASSTSTLKNALKGDKFYDYNLCAKGKASADQLEIAVCSEPHAAEAIGGKLNGKRGDAYPKDGNKIHTEARKFCQPLAKKFLGGARSDISFAENSGGKKPWSEGKMISGCFVETKDGSKLTKSLKGIGDKPLSSYK